MNKILKSAGLVALGVLSLPSAQADDGRLWGAQAAVKGFYDDNYNIAPTRLGSGAKNPAKRSSYGFDLVPTLTYDTLDTMGPSRFNASYLYDLRYYQDRANLHTSDADQSHDAAVGFTHKAETVTVNVNDEFVLSSLPGLLSSPSTPTATFLRANGNNIRNTGTVGDVWTLTPIFSLDTSYKNNYYKYQDKGHFNSYSAELDRIEHIADINLMYNWDPATILRFGYKFEYHDQTSKDLLATFPPAPPATFPAKIRNSESHFGYVGADWKINEEWSINPRAGMEYTRYPNVTGAGVSKSTVNPYVEAEATWRFSPEGAAVINVKHERNQTDVALQAGTTPTLDAESTVVTLGLNYQIMAQLSGRVTGSYQYSQFRGGTANGKRDNMFASDVGAEYEVYKDRFWVLAGYQYTRLDSELNFIAPRSFYRNQFYIGVRGSF